MKREILFADVFFIAEMKKPAVPKKPGVTMAMPTEQNTTK